MVDTKEKMLNIWVTYKHHIIMVLNMIVLIYCCWYMYHAGFYNGQIQQCEDLGMERYYVSVPGTETYIKCMSDKETETYNKYDKYGNKENTFYIQNLSQ